MPDSETLSVGFDPFDVTVTVPLALPAAVGVNVTLNVVYAPEAKVIGVVTGLKLKPVPLMATLEIVTDDPPVFVIFVDKVWLLPTVTLPKLKLDGFGDRSPGEIAVPDSETPSVGFDPFEVIVTVPLALPAAVGVNVTLNVVYAPAAKVIGVVTGLKLKPVPLMATFEIVTDDPPLFVIFVDKVWLLPTVTLPKPRLAGLAAKSPAAIAVAERGMVSGEFEASDVMVKLPLALPAVWGAKVTVAVVLCDAFSVIGAAMPLN